MIDFLISKPVRYTLCGTIAVLQIAIFGSLASVLTVGATEAIIKGGDSTCLEAHGWDSCN